ncbi:hypothetical protein Tco_0814857 [Tanacetum coccineum]
MGTPSQIMPPRMRTRSAGRPAAESLGGERVYGLVEVEGVEDLGKNSNSYLRDILGDILGKDMYYPLTFVKPIRVSLVYKRNPKAQCFEVRFEKYQ